MMTAVIMTVRFHGKIIDERRAPDYARHLSVDDDVYRDRPDRFAGSAGSR